jgi:hypothetical protein
MMKLAAIAFLIAATGCDRVGDFDLGEGEAYCGQITLGNQYREGLSPRVVMRMSFDADQVTAGASPGNITTLDAGADEGAQRLLHEAALRPIVPLAHDALSELTFGDGRDRNLIYAVDGSADAESLLAVLSLRSDDQVEVRLIRAGKNGSTDPGRKPLFGLFVLAREQGDCGI